MNIANSCRLLVLLCSVLSCWMLIEGEVSPAQAATTACSYKFTVSSKYSYLKYCVTANGNILAIETPSGHPQLGPGGEGYGVCQERPAVEYHDYAADDSGNWNLPILVSNTASSVKIARTTSDGHWTLTQTITKGSGPPSIKVVMALKNNQNIAATAYLVRYADVDANGSPFNALGATADMAFGFNTDPPAASHPRYGLLLENAGKQTFGFWQSLYQQVGMGPNACAWAYDGGQEVMYFGYGGLIMAYAGPVPALGTKTATMIYRGM